MISWTDCMAYWIQHDLVYRQMLNRYRLETVACVQIHVWLSLHRFFLITCWELLILSDYLYKTSVPYWGFCGFRVSFTLERPQQTYRDCRWREKCNARRRFAETEAWQAMEAKIKFTETLTAGLESMLASGAHADVTIVVDGKVFPCHKVSLAF